MYIYHKDRFIETQQVLFFHFVGLQVVFDRDYANGTFHKNGWYLNASDDAILAYKLLAQTGNPDNSVDESQVTKVRLVNAEGIINPSAFYYYLTVWISNDMMAYSYSMGEIRPETQTWPHDPYDRDMKSKYTDKHFYTITCQF